MKIAFISDFFYTDGIVGGAELVDNNLIKRLRDRGLDVQKIRSSELTEEQVCSYDFFIVSNFVNLSEKLKECLYDKSYIIYEHDHKYLRNRNPSVFSDFKAPQHMIINQTFYRGAVAVFCQSSLHEEVIKKNLSLINTVNAGCSLWSSEHLRILRKYCNNEKEESYAILDSQNSIKGTVQAENYCVQNNIKYRKIPFSDFEPFVQQLSSCEGLVFFPKTLETFCRVVVEARMLGCKLITNDWNGCTHEEWFPSYKGAELIDFVESKQDEIVDKVVKAIEGKQVEVNPEDITVILNCYRRPYNLRMQIESIRNQSNPPKEIWLWVNQHEDNQNFSFDNLDVDKVFHNNHNWKFYGRFAGALLADTEYIAIFDDDTIPGPKWFENCLETMETHEGILGSAGIILNDKYYVKHERCGWPTQNKETTEVDLVGHAWFFKRNWLQYLWKEKPPTWDNGEDIDFSSAAKVHGGVKTYCPPHPPDDIDMHGSILGNELGIDSKATSNNNETSHIQFFTERDYCVQEALKKGWQTVRGIKL